MIERHAGHIDICSSRRLAAPTRVSLGISRALDLLRRDDHLGGLGTARSGDGMVHEADRTHHLPRFAKHVVREVRRIAHDEVARRRLAVGHHALDMSVVVEEQLVRVAIQHEHAAFDRAETREALGKAAQTVHRIQERRGAVLVHGVPVQLDRTHRLQGWLVQIVVV